MVTGLSSKYARTCNVQTWYFLQFLGLELYSKQQLENQVAESSLTDVATKTELLCNIRGQSSHELGVSSIHSMPAVRFKYDFRFVFNLCELTFSHGFEIDGIFPVPSDESTRSLLCTLDTITVCPSSIIHNCAFLLLKLGDN